MDSYSIIKKKDLQEMLDKLPEDMEFHVLRTKLGVTIVSSNGKYITKKNVIDLAYKSKTLILSENKFMSQVDMHSKKQNLYGIKKSGVMNTVIIPKIQLE